MGYGIVDVVAVCLICILSVRLCVYLSILNQAVKLNIHAIRDDDSSQLGLPLLIYMNLSYRLSGEREGQ